MSLSSNLNDLTRSDYSSLSSNYCQNHGSFNNKSKQEQEHEFISIITHAKPAQISISDCNNNNNNNSVGDVEISKNQNQTHCYSYELVFQQNKIENFAYDSDISSLSSTSSALYSTLLEKFCGFIELSNGLLLLASVNGILGAINPQKSICKWNVVSKQINHDLPTNDGLYSHNEKFLIDLCVNIDNNEIILLTKYDSNKLNKYSYSIEIYNFNFSKFTMNLTNLLEIPQLLFSQTGVKIMTNTAYDYQFTRIYYDLDENCFILLDNKHHKIYWLLKQNCQIRRCIKSNDGESMESPSGLVLIKNPKIMYICNKKGLLICNSDKQPVTHDSLKPIDITFCPLEKAIYFIDAYSLYRFKLTDTNENEQRFKKIFSNKTLNENKLFKRVIACRDHLFIMTKNANSIFVVERSTLKF